MTSSHVNLIKVKDISHDIYPLAIQVQVLKIWTIIDIEFDEQVSYLNLIVMDSEYVKIYNSLYIIVYYK